jgi:[acyl-carrier-protein] S-malonyltransferase
VRLSASTDFRAIAIISGEITGSAMVFFFILDSTIKQIAAVHETVQSRFCKTSYTATITGDMSELSNSVRCAFLFPGQGSQYPGMGKGIYNEFPAARIVFEEADDTLGFSLSQLCFDGPEEELKKTENLQPALLTVSTAAYRVLSQKGVQPTLVAGHSLGEYSALVAAGALDFKDALRLVRKRGQFMQHAVPQGVGAMAALLKLPEGRLEGILAEAAQGEVVTAANINSPQQVVIAGHAGAVARAMELAKAAGAKRAILLPVSAPFHCPLMRPAQDRMRPELEATEFRDLAQPLINNWQAREIRGAAEARLGLVEQIPNPVRWTESMRLLPTLKIQKFIEVGPGTVLLGLCRSIDATLKGASYGEPSDWSKVEALLAEPISRVTSV